jgi:hypothetical protein
MKTRIIEFVLLLVWSSFYNACFAQIKIPFFIAISVKDLETEKKLNQLFFEITDEKSTKVTFPSTLIANEPLIVNLEPERVYKATISKQGYVKQVLTISTHNLSKSKQPKSKYSIEITGDMFEQFKGEDYTAFEKSFGIIKFNLRNNDFVWNPNKILVQKENEIKKTRRKVRKDKDIIIEKQIKNIQNVSPKIITYLPKASTPYDTLQIKSIETQKKTVNNGEVLITNIVFINGQTKEYRKISYKWGGIFFKLNQSDISELSYNLTKAKYGF